VRESPRHDDPSLLARLRRGDARAFEDMVIAYQHRVYGVALRMLGRPAEAEDVAQEAFLRAHLDAVGWISRNPDATRQVLARSLDLSGDLGQHVHLARWPTDARNDAALIDGMQPVLVRAGLLKAPLPARSLYDESLLEQVLAERR